MSLATAPSGQGSRTIDEPAGLEMERLREENDRLTVRFLNEEQRASDLMKLLLALRQLHEAVDRGALLAALEDVLINVLGSEELAIYVSDAPDSLVRARLVGTRAPEGLRIAGAADGAPVSLLRDRLLAALPEKPLACVPLVSRGRLVGAVVVLGLLEHRADLDASDVELLDLLSVHAGAALAHRLVP